MFNTSTSELRNSVSSGVLCIVSFRSEYGLLLDQLHNYTIDRLYRTACVDDIIVLHLGELPLERET